MDNDLKAPFSLIFAQVVVSVVLSALLLFYDWPAAYSALVGGMIATLANAWFTAKVFTRRHTDQPVALLRAMYSGELYKILLTGALFVVAFVLIRPINAVTLLITYFVVHITPALLGLIRANKTGDNIEERT